MDEVPSSPPPAAAHSEASAALASAWDALSDAKAKRRRLRAITSDFLERTPDVFGEAIETSMRPKP